MKLYHTIFYYATDFIAVMQENPAHLTCKVKFHPFVEFNLAKSHIPKGGI